MTPTENQLTQSPRNPVRLIPTPLRDRQPRHRDRQATDQQRRTPATPRTTPLAHNRSPTPDRMPHRPIASVASRLGAKLLPFPANCNGQGVPCVQQQMMSAATGLRPDQAAGRARLGSAVDLTARRDVHDEHEQLGFGHLVHDPVMADAHAPGGRVEAAQSSEPAGRGSSPSARMAAARRR